MASTMQQVADALVRRARMQGSLVAREVKAELQLHGMPEADWKEALQLAKGSLAYRAGRYYPKGSISPRLEQEQTRQQAIQKIIRQLIKQHRARSKQDERRGQSRVHFIQPVKIVGEDGKSHVLLSRDLSPTGIRLIGTRGLLGQKVKLLLPLGEDKADCVLLTRILWTCAVGDDLFENGGTFLEVLADS
jgi:hypothetical protein